MGSGDSLTFSEVTEALGRPRPQAWVVWSEPVHASCRGGWFLVASMWCVCVKTGRPWSIPLTPAGPGS